MEREIDGLFERAASLCATNARETHEQPIEVVLDSFFAFLSRRTDFFVDDERARDAVRSALERRANAEARLSDSKGKTTTKTTSVTNADEENVARARAEARERANAEENARRVERVRAVQEERREATETEKTIFSEIKRDGVEETIGGEKEEDLDALAPGTMAPNRGNGGDAEKYSWTQTLEDVDVRVPVPPGTKSKQIRCDFTKDKFSFRVNAASGANAPPELVIEGDLFAPVATDECYWTLEDGAVVAAFLVKRKGLTWWPHVLTCDPKIDVKKVVPENSKLSDLDGETRVTVEKMMYDQRQKALGLPTADEEAKQSTLQKFMAAHPEMDFSNCKFDGAGGSFPKPAFSE